MRSFALAAVTSALLLAGCGETSDEDDVKQAFDDYFAAIKQKDGDKLCDSVVSPDAVKLSKDERAEEIQACKDDFSASEFDDAPDLEAAEVDKVTVKGDRATATVTATVNGRKERSEVQFLKVDGDWKQSFNTR